MKETLQFGGNQPKIINGLWQIADMEKSGQMVSEETFSKVAEEYVKNGLPAFDMADHYGSAESLCGYFGKNNPLGEKAFFMTKWVPEPGKINREKTREAIFSALKNLRRDSIDLLQYHTWNYLDPIWLDHLFWLTELKEEGVIKNLGLTNFDAIHLRIACASGIPIATNQVSYSLLDQRAAGTMTDTCKEFGVQILAYGTLAGGFLSEKWLDKNEPSSLDLDNWSLSKYYRFIQQAGGWAKLQQILQVLKTISTKNNVSISNIASKYIMEKSSVGAVIIGIRPGVSQHLEDTLILNSFSLDSIDQLQIEEVLENFEPIPGDCGDEYRKPPFLTASGDLSHHLNNMPLPYDKLQGPENSEKVFSGTPWEPMAGYCRAIRKNNRIFVSGTTANHENRLIGGKDPAAQTYFILDKIEAAIQSLGGKMEQVVRTRIFVNNVEDWEPVARAHGVRFKNIQPANTLVEAKLVGNDLLVEIEANVEL